MSQRYKIVFQPSGRRGVVEAGKTLLEAAQALGVDLESICGGKGTCGKCKVRLEEGYFEKEGLESRKPHLSPESEAERKFVSPDEGPQIRLACTTCVLGDVSIFVPEKSRAGKQIVRKAAKEIRVPVDPAVKKYYIELRAPTLQDPPLADFERLREGLQHEYGLEGLSIDYFVLKDLQDTLRAADWRVTVSVWLGREIVKLEPGFVDVSCGLAVDVGTTTVAAYLCELETGKILSTESMMNPQVPHGEDVMSRITYSMSNENGLATMQQAIIRGMNDLIEKTTADVRTPDGNRGHSIVDMTVVCNTAMHHIFLGFNPEYIGKSPFVPTAQDCQDIKARQLGIDMNPASYIHVLPIEAGFVGADNVGVLLAEEPYGVGDRILIIDIGTNGELLLGNKNGICSASCATGPAFEGAEIKFGMRAAPGAIEKVEIDSATKEPRYKVIGKADWHTHVEKVNAKGICGSGVIDAVAEMYKAGILCKNGIIGKDLDIPRVRKGPDEKMEYVLAWADETSIGTDITVTQADVRAVLLAKGALYAGAKLLMKKMGIERLDRVFLAGAFGSYINKESALALGMFPDCPIDRVYAVGNAAGDGAIIALLNAEKRVEARERARWVQYVEIAMEPGFPKEFMKAMQIPHMEDTFPNLESLLGRTETNSSEAP